VQRKGFVDHQSLAQLRDGFRKVGQFGDGVGGAGVVAVLPVIEQAPIARGHLKRRNQRFAVVLFQPRAAVEALRRSARAIASFLHSTRQTHSLMPRIARAEQMKMDRFIQS
jgi:hypothetical protein